MGTIRIMTPDALREEMHWCLLQAPQLSLPGLPSPPRVEGLAALLAGAELDTTRALPMRIGRRFEAHWQWAFEHLPDWDLLAHNCQIRDGKRTLGAPDLLVRNQRDVWHIELAVKFYLCHPERSGDAPEDWVGPSVRDSLSRKLERMKTHQLPLLQGATAQAALRAQGLPLPTQTAAIVRGILFSHWQQPHPQAVGRWCWQRELPLLEVLPLSRQEWLGATPQASWGPAPQAVSGPTQVMARDSRRWMIVPDRWPG